MLFWLVYVFGVLLCLLGGFEADKNWPHRTSFCLSWPFVLGTIVVAGCVILIACTVRLILALLILSLYGAWPGDLFPDTEEDLKKQITDYGPQVQEFLRSPQSAESTARHLDMDDPLGHQLVGDLLRHMYGAGMLAKLADGRYLSVPKGVVCESASVPV